MVHRCLVVRVRVHASMTVSEIVNAVFVGWACWLSVLDGLDAEEFWVGLCSVEVLRKGSLGPFQEKVMVILGRDVMRRLHRHLIQVIMTMVHELMKLAAVMARKDMSLNDLLVYCEMLGSGMRNNLHLEFHPPPSKVPLGGFLLTALLLVHDYYGQRLLNSDLALQ